MSGTNCDFAGCCGTIQQFPRFGQNRNHGHVEIATLPGLMRHIIVIPTLREFENVVDKGTGASMLQLNGDLAAHGKPSWLIFREGINLYLK